MAYQRLIWALLALVVAACRAGPPSTLIPIAQPPVVVSQASACHNAFELAAGVDVMHDTIADMYPATLVCSHAEWVAEWEGRTEDRFRSVPPDLFLTNICDDVEVRDSPLCLEIR